MVLYKRGCQVITVRLFASIHGTTILFGSNSCCHLNIRIGCLENTILPFVMMLFAIVLYFLSKTIIKKISRTFYYKGILLANSFSLVLFYFSGNYLVVRAFSLAANAEITTGHDIHLHYSFMVLPLLPILFLL
jgi:hypothetical protein